MQENNSNKQKVVTHNGKTSELLTSVCQPSITGMPVYTNEQLGRGPSVVCMKGSFHGYGGKFKKLDFSIT